MRRCRVLLAVLLAVLLGGCVTDRQAPAPSWLQRFRPFQGEAGRDAVQMDIALIEVPIGDHFVNGGLWALVDEQVVSLEKKAVLEDNGFRVAQVSAPPPAELLELLTSRRSCPDPHRTQLQAGKAGRPLDLGGPPRSSCRFQIVQGEQRAEVELEQARCTLLVVPFLTEDGRTRLEITPQVAHAGKGLAPWQPRADRSGWTLRPEQAEEAYPALSWEVTLAPNDYVVIGGRYDRPGTLGHVAFVRTDEPVPLQRLLVIRTARPAAGTDFTPSLEGGAAPRPVPLALQAAWPTVPGVSP